MTSFRDVCDLYFDFVWRSARHMGVPADAIDDVVQDIFVVVHTRLQTLERPAALRSWIYSIVRRTVSTCHRAQHVRAGHESSAPALDHTASRLQPSPLDLAVLSDEVRLVWCLFGELDPDKREVLVLAEVYEMPVPEIAEAVGIPLNTAYSRLRAGRHEFNDALLRHCAAQTIKDA